MKFHCYDCGREITTKNDEVSYFDNSVCSECETKMFLWMQEQAKNLKATSPDTIERFNESGKMKCHKCGSTDGVVEVESMDQAINFCTSHLEEFQKTYATAL